VPHSPPMNHALLVLLDHAVGLPQASKTGEELDLHCQPGLLSCRGARTRGQSIKHCHPAAVYQVRESACTCWAQAAEAHGQRAGGTTGGMRRVAPLPLPLRPLVQNSDGPHRGTALTPRQPRTHSLTRHEQAATATLHPGGRLVRERTADAVRIVVASHGALYPTSLWELRVGHETRKAQRLGDPGQR
jgi:hypothetical protein